MQGKPENMNEETLLCNVEKQERLRIAAQKLEMKRLADIEEQSDIAYEANAENAGRYVFIVSERSWSGDEAIGVFTTRGMAKEFIDTRSDGDVLARLELNSKDSTRKTYRC